ncbi:MAG TPA: MFS transporter [Devosiaceae bacterium]|jgi:predicted MFS family arabinose efflux permease|nr:MFS transporter [Devosiaceae bacterium]
MHSRASEGKDSAPAPLRGPGQATAVLLVLALGHTISNLVRTMPAVSADVIAVSLSISPGDVAAITGLYHLAFAVGQIPVGVALDRYSVRSVAIVLLTVIAAGAFLTTIVQGAVGFSFAQVLLGLGCSGMLLCPLSYAARTKKGANFAIWSALVLAVGNSGMLISASPMAWVVETAGWRVAFAITASLATLVALAVWFAAERATGTSGRAASIGSEFVQVARFGLSKRLRGVVFLAFVSFAVMIGIRGLWAGPWLMDVKGLSRIEAGNIILALTVMLIVMPMAASVVDRWLQKRTQALLIAGHVAAGVLLLLISCGGANGWVSGTFSRIAMPPTFDLLLLMAFGIAISVQPLLFALGRQSVPAEHAGKALAAVNLAFFAGAAVIQALSAPVVSIWGLSGVIGFLGLLSIAGALAFGWAGREVRA